MDTVITEPRRSSRLRDRMVLWRVEVRKLNPHLPSEKIRTPWGCYLIHISKRKELARDLATQRPSAISGGLVARTRVRTRQFHRTAASKASKPWVRL